MRTQTEQLSTKIDVGSIQTFVDLEFRYELVDIDLNPSQIQSELPAKAFLLLKT